MVDYGARIVWGPDGLCLAAGKLVGKDRVLLSRGRILLLRPAKLNGTESLAPKTGPLAKVYDRAVRRIGGGIDPVDKKRWRHAADYRIRLEAPFSSHFVV